MLEEKLNILFSGFRNTARQYLAAATIAIGSAIAYAGCGDEDTCKTSADCSEGSNCRRECCRCTDYDGDEDGVHCLQENCRMLSRDNRSSSGEQCGAYHCYRSSQTTTHTRVD